ncbi:MAG: HAD family hydrolase [Bacteroidetes bacterium]|nr:HAD family hydrolase [Bacteroidota bacterium]
MNTEDLANRIVSLTEEKEPIPTSQHALIPNAKRIKAVMLDVYGTLLITGTEPGLASDSGTEHRALQDALNALGYDVSKTDIPAAIEQLHERIQHSHKEQREKGIDYPEVDILAIWRALPALTEVSDDDIPTLITEFVSRVEKPWLMPGLAEMMDVLNSNGIAVGIISNAQFYTPITLEALTGQSLHEIGFDPELCFFSYACNIAKPSTKFYQLAADKLARRGIAPSQVLYIGNDMLKDVYPSMQIGFNSALFAGDQRSLRLREDDDRCKNLHPDAVFTHLSQVVHCLGIL